MITRIWHEVWSLPFAVGIAGNLAASLIVGTPAVIGLWRKLDRQHREHMNAISKDS